jgi:uncharacterized protein (DUF4415 family)
MLEVIMAAKKKSAEVKRGRGRPAVGPKQFVSASIDVALYDRFQKHRDETQLTPSGIITLALRQYFDKYDAAKADA